jgi:hypothetical protein
VPRLWRSDHDGDSNPALPGWADVLAGGPPGLVHARFFASLFVSPLEAIEGGFLTIVSPDFRRHRTYVAGLKSLTSYRLLFCMYDSQSGRVCVSWIENPIPGFGCDR